MRTAFKSIAYALPFQERKSEYTTSEISVPFVNLRTGNGIVSGANVRDKGWYSTSQLIPVVGTTIPKAGAYTASAVEIAVPVSFEGEGFSVNLRAYVQQFAVYRNRMKYAWAICSSNANRNKYIGFGDAGIEDDNQLGFGDLDCPYDYDLGNAKGKFREFNLRCSRKFNGSGTIYIYLFPKAIQSSDNIHIASQTEGSAADGSATVIATYDTFVSVNYLR